MYARIANRRYRSIVDIPHLHTSHNLCLSVCYRLHAETYYYCNYFTFLFNWLIFPELFQKRAYGNCWRTIPTNSVKAIPEYPQYMLSHLILQTTCLTVSLKICHNFSWMPLMTHKSFSRKLYLLLHRISGVILLNKDKYNLITHTDNKLVPYDNKYTSTKPSEKPVMMQRCQSLEADCMYCAAHTMPTRITSTGIRYTSCDLQLQFLQKHI